MAGADVGPDHDACRAAQTVAQGDQDKFEPRGSTVAGQSGHAGVGDIEGNDGNGQVRARANERGHPSNAQDLAEWGRAHARRPDRRMQDAMPAPKMHRKEETADAIVGKDCDRPAVEAKRGERAEAEDQGRQQRQEQQRPAANDDQGQDEVAGSADRGKQQVEHPDQHGAGEDQVGIACRDGKGGAVCAHGPVEPWPGAKHDQRRRRAKADRNREGIPDELACLVALAAADGPRDRRHDATPDRALRKRADQRENREDEGDPRQGVGAEAGHEIDLHQADRHLGKHDGRIRRSQSQQRGQNGRFQQHSGPLVQCRGPRRLGLAGHVALVGNRSVSDMGRSNIRVNPLAKPFS